MKSVKRILVLMMAVAMTFGAVTAFATDGILGEEKVDRFKLMEDRTDGDRFSMISHDGELVIHINDKTPIIFEDGTDVRELLEEGQVLSEVMNDRMLIVTYSIVATSYPPQTTPEGIVVMFEQAVHLPGDIYELTLNGEIIVGSDMIEAPLPYLKDGVVMVPLRAIAEKLGFDVTWDHETKGVRLGVAINLWIGKDEYHVGRMAPIELGTAPELKDGFTFVPLDFFGLVVAGFDTYVFEQQVVVIASEENDMQ